MASTAALGLSQPVYLNSGPLVLVMEELQGDIDGANKVFHASHVPVPGSSIWVFLRAQLRYEPTDFVSAGNGVDFKFTDPLRFGDPRPRVIYLWDPQIQEETLEPALAGQGSDQSLEMGGFVAALDSFTPMEPQASMPWLGIL